MSQSLGRDRRLQHRWEYLRFFSGSEVFRLSECIVYRIKNDCGHFRLGITVKAKGSSVERNRVKRVVREFFRKLAPALGGFDFNVVIPRTKKMAHPYPKKLLEELRKELADVLVQKNI